MRCRGFTLLMRSIAMRVPNTVPSSTEKKAMMRVFFMPSAKKVLYLVSRVHIRVRNAISAAISASRLSF